MRTGGALVMIAAAMATAWAAAGALHEMPPRPGVDTEITTAAIPRPAGEVFRLSSVTANESCLVVKGKTLSAGLAELKVNPTCERLMPGIGRARFWRERADGSVAFSTGSSGIGALSAGGSAPLVEFTPSDGAEYESYAPSSVFLSLTSQ